MTKTTRLIGLTGGIGAGKSEALAAFARRGAETISADAVVHELLGDGEMRQLLVGRWGEDVAPDGQLDRQRIAERVFKEPEELAWLESQLHPRVGERIATWAASLDQGAIGVVEVPLLFETGMQDLFDAVVCVVSDDAVRTKRAAVRGQGGLEAREDRQLSQDEKAARADHVIENDGTLEELEEKIATLVQQLSQAN